MSFVANRFAALSGEESSEVDKLGNTKPLEKKESEQPPTRREQRRATQKRVPAVSPPSRREHRSGTANSGARPIEENVNPTQVVSEKAEKRAMWKEGKSHRPMDRHSRTGIYDNEKKANMGWGPAGTSEYQGANDVYDARDPGVDGGKFRTEEEQPEENTKTLEEYLQSKKQLNLPALTPRQANEGSDNAEWKNAVALQKDDDTYFVGKREANSKSKNKSKKGKAVYLEIHAPSTRRHPPPHTGQRQTSSRLNLSDAHAFPTLGA